MIFFFNFMRHVYVICIIKDLNENLHIHNTHRDKHLSFIYTNTRIVYENRFVVILENYCKL